MSKANMLIGIVKSVSPVAEAAWTKGMSAGLDVSAVLPTQMDGKPGAFLIADVHDNYIGVQHMVNDEGEGYELTLSFDKYNKLTQPQLQDLALLIIGTSPSVDKLTKMGFSRQDY